MVVKDIQPIATAVIANIFETMFFIFLEPWEDREAGEGAEGLPPKIEHPPEPKFSSDVISSEIEFLGPSSGKIQLNLPYELGKRMTANFLGSNSQEVSPSQTLDMARELINMISGNLFSRLQRNGSIRIALPLARMISAEELENRPIPSGIALEFVAEGQRIKLEMQFEP